MLQLIGVIIICTVALTIFKMPIIIITLIVPLLILLLLTEVGGLFFSTPRMERLL